MNKILNVTFRKKDAHIQIYLETQFHISTLKMELLLLQVLRNSTCLLLTSTVSFKNTMSESQNNAHPS